MNTNSLVLLVAALGFGSFAQGQVFKCTTPEGKVSFASTPCPEYVGQASAQRSGPAKLSSEWEESDYPHRVNLNATDILKVNRRAKIIIVNEKEISDRLQKNRLPPPALPSACTAPRFESDCFDPSGGKIRKPAKP